MISVLRRLGRWLCRHDLEPAQDHFRWIVVDEFHVHTRDEIANALAYLRILKGHDPADVSKEP